MANNITNNRIQLYQVIYQKNSKNGIKGEIKEQGYKIDNICYKVTIKNK